MEQSNPINSNDIMTKDQIIQQLNKKLNMKSSPNNNEKLYIKYTTFHKKIDEGRKATTP